MESVWWLAFFSFFKLEFFQQNSIRKLMCQRHKNGVGTGWGGHSSAQTAFPSSFPWKILRHLACSRTPCPKPKIWSSSIVSPIRPRNVKLVFWWHNQSCNCVPVASQYSTTRKNGQDPNTWERLTELLSEFQMYALFSL